MRGKRTKQRAQFLILGLIPAHAGKTTRPTPSQSKPGAHPHSRRENVIDDGEARTGGGSSPLTRGKQSRQPSVRAIRGLIPAHAGKTSAITTILETLGAHPRSRGENIYVDWQTLHSAGSSPLTRGKRRDNLDSDREDGLIPTHAGKTPACPSPFYRRWAHPRSRGENTAIPRRCVSRRGSSPLTRGKRHVVPPRRIHQGLIPAHAGKTSASPYGTARKWAHPRSYGENGFIQVASPANEGSSPLMRGKRDTAAAAVGAAGLIPAHAGKTHRSAHCACRRGAHPRSRGENFTVSSTRRRRGGSSPLTRGKLPRWQRPTIARRLIPAHAGKTLPGESRGRSPRAHPRSRGENSTSRLVAAAGAGSSPLTRGKRERAV